MKITYNLQIASRMLSVNKMRSILTMLGIIIGNASVIAMIGIGNGAQKLATEQFERLGPNSLFVIPGSRKARNNAFEVPRTLVLKDAKAIASLVPTVQAVAPEINRRQLITQGNRDTMTMVIGTTPESQNIRRLNLAEGRFFNDLDVQRNRRVMVLGSEVAEQLFEEENPVGKKVRIKNVTLEIIGVMQEKGSFLGTNQDDAVYIPFTVMVTQLVGNTSPYGIELSLINIEAKPDESIEDAQFQIENLLRLRHQIINEDDFSVETPKQVLQIFNAITTGLTMMLAAIAGISLIVGGIGVMNIMLVSVTERTKEIGLRKALGAKKQDILIQFLSEAVVLSVTGGFLGIVLGGGVLLLIGSVSPLAPTVSSLAIIISVGFSSGIGLVSGIFPAYRAAKLDPIIALRTS